MDTKYIIKLYDNGWTIEDTRSLTHQVVQEKNSDKKHLKIKHLLGEWLFEDMDVFLNEIEDIECAIEIKFKKTEEEE